MRYKTGEASKEKKIRLSVVCSRDSETTVAFFLVYCTNGSKVHSFITFFRKMILQLLQNRLFFTFSVYFAFVSKCYMN